jgi:hypothetical protein
MMTPFETRQRVVVAGFVPIPFNGKRPVLDDCQKRTDASPGDIDIWSQLFPDATNTGIVTRLVPAFDIDILNPDAAAAVEDMVRERYGDASRICVRFGLAPKRAVPFNTGQPFKKIEMKLISPNVLADQKIQKLEVLGDGQQLVVAGIHPDTDRPYRWWGGEFGEIKRCELPPISLTETQALVTDAVELLVREHGYQQKDTAGGDRVLALRLGETANALTTVLASTLSLSPSSARSRAAIKKTADGFRRMLQTRVRQAERDPLFADFRSRCFRDDDERRWGRA